MTGKPRRPRGGRAARKPTALPVHSDWLMLPDGEGAAAALVARIRPLLHQLAAIVGEKAAAERICKEFSGNRPRGRPEPHDISFFLAAACLPGKPDVIARFILGLDPEMSPEKLKRPEGRAPEADALRKRIVEFRNKLQKAEPRALLRAELAAYLAGVFEGRELAQVIEIFQSLTNDGELTDLAAIVAVALYDIFYGLFSMTETSIDILLALFAHDAVAAVPGAAADASAAEADVVGDLRLGLADWKDRLIVEFQRAGAVLSARKMSADEKETVWAWASGYIQTWNNSRYSKKYNRVIWSVLTTRTMVGKSFDKRDRLLFWPEPTA